MFDGSVIIDTSLDSSGVKIGAEEIERRINSFVSTTARIGNQIKSVFTQKAGAISDSLRGSVSTSTEEIRQKIEALADAKIPTDEYKRLCAEIEKVDEQAKKLEDRKKKMTALGVPEDSKQWDSLYYDLARLEEKYASFSEEKQRMEANGSAFTSGRDTEEYRRANEELSQLQNSMSAGATHGQGFLSMLSLLGPAIKTVAVHAFSLGQRLAQIGFNAFAAGAKRAISGIRALASGVKSLAVNTGKAISRLKSLKILTHKTDLSTNGLVKSLTSLKRLLITRIKRMFISAIFNNVREGLRELAKHSKAFDKQMSNIKNSASRLSGNIAVTLGGIISAVEPVLTRIIDLLAQGVDWINQFIAALQGKSSYASAKKGVESYADATDKAASAQKKLNRELYSFDELNRQGNYDDNNNSNSSAITYVDKPITLPGAVTDWIERLKGAWENADWKGIGRVIADGINAVFGKLDSLISWENIGDTITRIVTGIADILNSMVEGIDWQKIGRTFGSGINTIVNTLYLLLTSIDWYAIGKALATGLNGLVGRVDWDKLGRLFSARINALFDTIRGFAENFKWGDAGTAFGNAVNALKNEVNWYNLGDSLKKLLKGAVALMQYAVKTIEWGDAGTKFAEALNAFFKQDSLWADAGDTIDETIKGLLDFTEKAVITFDEKQFADDLKAMFGGVDWDGIARETWNLMKLAFQKAGSFVNALLNESIDPEKAGLSGEYLAKVTEFNQKSLGEKLGIRLREALSAIPWESIASDLWGAARTALTNAGGFITSLFDVTDADVKTAGGNKALATGRKIGEMIANAIGQIDWAEFGTQFSNTVTGLFDTLNGFFQGMGNAGEGESKSKLQTAIEEFFGHIDWDAVTSSILSFAAEFFIQLGKNLGGAIITGIKSIFTPHEIVEVEGGGTQSAVEEMAESLVGATTEAVIKEFQAQTPKVEIAIEQAAQTIMDAADSEAKGENEAEQFYSGFKNTVFDQNGQVKEEFVGVLSTIFTAGDLEAIQNGEMSAYDFVDKFSSSALIKTDDGISAMDQFYATVLGAYDTGAKGKELGTNIDDGIIEGVESKKDEVAKSLDDTLMKPYEDNIAGPNGYDTNSPSKTTQKLGQNVVEGYTAGMESQKNDANSRSKTLFDSFFDTIIKTAEAMQQFQTIILNALSNLETHFPIRLETYRRQFEKGWSDINSVTATGWTSIQSAAISGMSALASNVSYMARELGDAVTNQGWWSVGDYIVAGIQNGVIDNWRWLKQTVRNLADSLYDTARNALGIHSPSTVFAEIGQFVDAGLQQGLEDGERDVLQTAANIADAVTNEMTPDNPEVDVSANSMIGGMQAVISGLGSVAETFMVILDTIRSMGGLMTPQIAAGTVVPYKTKIDTASGDNADLIDTLESLNGDLESVIIQSVNNAVVAIVDAIQNHSGNTNPNDLNTLTKRVIDEINRRTRAQGSSPILI